MVWVGRDGAGMDYRGGCRGDSGLWLAMACPGRTAAGVADRPVEVGFCTAACSTALAFVGSLFGSFWAATSMWRSYFFDPRLCPWSRLP